MKLSDLDRVIEQVSAAHDVLNLYHDDYEETVPLGDALDDLRKMRDEAVEVRAWRYDGAWLASSHSPGTSGDIAERPALLIAPEDA